MDIATLGRIKVLEEEVRALRGRLAVLEQKPGAPLEELIDRYIAKFGKKPHHKMKVETIERALNGG